LAYQVPFDRDEQVEYGVAETMSPMVRRVVARNPGRFTFHGTGTFILGRGRVAVIDPGPDLPEHVAALTRNLDGETVTHLVVTHTHRDHSPACAPLKALTGAPTYGFGPHGSGRVGRGEEVEEGADRDFDPDVRVRDGDVVAGDGWTLECVHTPGHTSNHVCYGFRQERTLFCGDHVMGWNTTIVSPPDGDMGAYMASLRRLLERDDALYRPTHGPAIGSPQAYVEAYLHHREDREAEILRRVDAGVARIHEMVEEIYRELPMPMHGAAARQVFATVVHLVERGVLICEGVPALDSDYVRGSGKRARGGPADGQAPSPR
jgi:glyoxylase-like metal-dependent hydrolase (beta-lactamase superfamily II)